MDLVSNIRLTNLYSCKADYKDAYDEYTFYKLFDKEGDCLISLDRKDTVEQPGLIESNACINSRTDTLGYKIITGDCFFGYITYPIVPINVWCFPIKVLKKDIIAVEESLTHPGYPGKVAFFKYRITYQAWSVVFKKGIMVWCNQ